MQQQIHIMESFLEAHYQEVDVASSMEWLDCKTRAKI